MMEARVVNIPDPNDFEDPDTTRDLISDSHGLGYRDLVLASRTRIAEPDRLKVEESAITIARTRLLDNGVDKMTIEGWLNGQG
jgi:hypothetical protein